MNSSTSVVDASVIGLGEVKPASQSTRRVTSNVSSLVKVVVVALADHSFNHPNVNASSMLIPCVVPSQEGIYSEPDLEVDIRINIETLKETWNYDAFIDDIFVFVSRDITVREAANMLSDIALDPSYSRLINEERWENRWFLSDEILSNVAKPAVFDAAHLKNIFASQASICSKQKAQQLRTLART